MRAVAVLGCLVPVAARAQLGASNAPAPPSPTVQVQTPAVEQPPSQFQSSVVKDKATDGVLSLSIKDAIDRGLRYNLGYVLQSATAENAAGQKLQMLQPLLPTVLGSARVSVQQIDLAAEGLRIPGFPQVLGPFGSVDIRASLSWAVLNLPALETYLAAHHNYESAKLSIEDARELVVLSVGNAYLTVIADASRVTATQAQVDSTKASLDQAVANHQAGTSPLLDEVRARVDYQTQQQQLIAAQNAFEKDKIALARAIGLPLDQKFTLTEDAPYAPLDNITPQQAEESAFKNRKDLAAQREGAKAGASAARGAHEERLPSLAAVGDYGLAGVNLGTIHGSGEAIGQGQVPIFEEFKIRGDEKIADAQKRQLEAQYSSTQGQVVADVRDSLLDLESAQKSVEVARSNVDLAKEALSEAQQRFAAGVSDNLAVVQAQASVAQANEQYIASLYQHNLAKLELARAMGVVYQSYQQFLGGK